MGAVLGVQFFEGRVSNCAYGPVDEGTAEAVAAATCQASNGMRRLVSVSAVGLLQAGAVVWGEGRAVILAEAAMCTAQIFGASSANPVKTGMNNPMASQNPLFCLNVVRWLAGLLPASR